MLFKSINIWIWNYFRIWNTVNNIHIKKLVPLSQLLQSKQVNINFITRLHLDISSIICKRVFANLCLPDAMGKLEAV